MVPFKATPDVVTAIRGGELHAGLDILSPLLTQIQGKALRALAVTGAKRSRVLPSVPTAREAGVKGLNAASWNGLAVPAKTPATVVERLSREVQAALAQPDVKKRLLELNLNAQGSTPAQLGEHLAADVRRWSDVIAKAKIARQ